MVAGLIERVEGRENQSVQGANRFMTLLLVSGPMSDPRGATRTRTGEDAGRYLREHEREFRRLTEHANEVFWIGDPRRFGTVYANAAFEEVWGRPREELYENPETLLESIHPEDRERVVDAVENEIERGGFDETYRIERPDGSSAGSTAGRSWSRTRTARSTPSSASRWTSPNESGSGNSSAANAISRDGSSTPAR
ncbi:PAS domain-containing protein [Halalkalicoccus salilacus]|uniref:PAS domain-containing protein n=1 Tax=Halalkalicoccus sp. GCM10025704 TaxID=3252662 RepID=UPI003610378C